jgi:hypothetical protein
MPLIVWGANVIYPMGSNQVHSSFEVRTIKYNKKDEEAPSPRKGFSKKTNRKVFRSGKVDDDEF